MRRHRILWTMTLAAATALLGFALVGTLIAADEGEGAKAEAKSAGPACKAGEKPACAECKPGEPCAKCAARRAGQGMRLEQAMKALDAAAAALEKDDAKGALAHVQAARKLLAACVEHAKAGPAAAAVNVRCPIMGKAIDPDKVPDDLTRTYHGHKVGFCCAGCLTEWDKLTDEQRHEKLGASLPCIRCGKARAECACPKPGAGKS